MSRTLPFLLFKCILIISGCSTASEQSQNDQTDSVQQQYQDNKPVIYQVFTRLFGNTKTHNITYGTREENGVGKFSDFTPSALKAIHDLGITHVWYTGVIEHATMTDHTENGIPLDDADVVKGRAGSPYAIKDYYDVDPDLADDVPNRLAEFDALIERTHNQDLKVVIDFVANHVARAYHSDAKPDGIVDLGEGDDRTKAFDPNNNFYYLPGKDFIVPPEYDPLGSLLKGPGEDGYFQESPAKATGNDVFTEAPKVDDWFETVKLNYGIDYQNDRAEHFDPIPDTWNKMRDILLYWAGRDVDGFRCDMAQMVPPAFWSWVIRQVKAQYPDIIFIAEIYEPDRYQAYLNAGFDYLYDKVGTYDAMRKLITGQTVVDEVLETVNSLDSIDPHLVRFLENHDEQRIASTQFAGDPWKGWPGMVVSATIGQGPVMIYFGQEVGEPGNGTEGFQGDDGRTTIFDYWGVPEHQKWMNNGQFDGGQLSLNQQKLRSAYQTLLTTIRGNQTFAHGKRIFLQDKISPEHLRQKLVAFLIAADNTYLVLASFSDKSVNVSVDLSEYLEGKVLKDILGSKKEMGPDTFDLSLDPYEALILQLQDRN